MPEEDPAGELQRFCEQESEWLKAAGEGEAVYCIPPKAIQRLSVPRARRAPLVDRTTAQREQRFWAACREANACGVYGNQPIYYPCLWEPYGLTPEQLKKVVYPMFADAEAFDATALMQVHTGSWERLKGYVGWLMTDPDFLRHRDAVRSLWAAISGGTPPCAPFGRTAAPEVFELFDKSAYTKTKVAFFEAVNRLLEQWNLSQLTTWDLPLPFGPFLSDDVWTHTQAIAKHSVHLVLPVHYPLTTSDELLAEIRKKQRRVAEEHGLSPHIAALPHYDFLGRMLEVQHIEQTIRSRYVRAGYKAGAVTLIEGAVADAIGVSVAQTVKLRKAISACRRGKRDHVPWLNDRA